MQIYQVSTLCASTASLVWGFWYQYSVGNKNKILCDSNKIT